MMQPSAMNSSEAIAAGMNQPATGRGANSSSIIPPVTLIAPEPAPEGGRAQARPLAFDDDLGAHAGQAVEPLGELDRQPNAAVARRIAGVGAAVKSDALIVVHLHERHRRVVVLAAETALLLAHHRPE